MTIPPHTSIYVAHYIGAQVARIGDPDYFTLSFGADGPTADVFVLTFAIRQLALQIFTLRWARNFEPTEEVKIGLSAQAKQKTIDVYPATEVSQWPPLLKLDDVAMNRFVDRFAHHFERRFTG